MSRRKNQKSSKINLQDTLHGKIVLEVSNHVHIRKGENVTIHRYGVILLDLETKACYTIIPMKDISTINIKKVFQINTINYTHSDHYFVSKFFRDSIMEKELKEHGEFINTNFSMYLI